MADELTVQFLCNDVDNFIKEIKELIEKYASDSVYGLDVSVEIKSFS